MGDGDLNIPYEDDPAAVQGQPVRPDMSNASLATGVVILALTVSHPITGKPHPALSFRFATGLASFYPDMVLLVERPELEALKQLLADTIDGAVRAADKGVN
jgi:hypothetical protein